jgi:hypothetical protein
VEVGDRDNRGGGGKSRMSQNEEVVEALRLVFGAIGGEEGEH